MARGINKAIIIGNLGQAPEIRYTANGTAVANLRIATTESWKDKQTGEKKEVTEWHTVVLFGKTAEIAGQYLAKGRQVYIEGRLQTRKWQDKSGADRYSTEIIASDMQMIGGAPQGGNGNGGQGGNESGSQGGAAQGGTPAGAPFLDDDIPFAPLPWHVA